MNRLPYLAIVALVAWLAYILLPPFWWAQTQAHLGFIFIGSIVVVLAAGFLAGAAFMAGRRS